MIQPMSAKAYHTVALRWGAGNTGLQQEHECWKRTYEPQPKYACPDRRAAQLKERGFSRKLVQISVPLVPAVLRSYGLAACGSCSHEKNVHAPSQHVYLV